MGCMPWLRAEAGSRPGGRPPFLARASKGGKRTRPAACDPSAMRWGNLRRGACGVRRKTLYALRAPFEQLRRVRSRSGRTLRCVRHPASTTPQAQSEGVDAYTGRRCARPRFQGAALVLHFIPHQTRQRRGESRPLVFQKVQPHSRGRMLHAPPSNDGRAIKPPTAPTARSRPVAARRRCAALRVRP